MDVMGFRRICGSVCRVMAVSGCLFLLSESNSLACSPELEAPAERFRQIFFKMGKEQYSETQLSSLIYLPTSDLERSDTFSFRAENPLESFDRVVANWKPSDAFLLGAGRQPCFATSAPWDVFSTEARTQEELPLFVIVPELLAEIVDNQPFREMSNNPESVFSKFWQSQLVMHSDGPDTWDWSFRLVKMQRVPVPLSELFTTGNLDAPNGNPLANVVSFRALMGSTESIGTPAETAAAFLPRLTKFWRVVGTPQKIYFLGYSRGANVALQMLSDAAQHAEKYPWVSNVRGVITFAGVNFGAIAADNVLTPGSPLNEIDKALLDLSNSLQDQNGDENSFELSQKIASNTWHWVNDGARFLGKVSQFPLAYGFAKENPRLAIPTRDALVQYIYRFFFETFRLDKPVTDYFGNVRRFKYFVNQFQKSVVALSTKSRLEWWSTHTLPAGTHLMAVAGTMGDPWLQEEGVWVFTKNPLAYDPAIFDFSLLRMSYYENVRKTGFRVNDGMVSVERALFWPNLIAKLNPQNASVVTHNLALLGVDHFGLALESAAPSAEPHKSPFPRQVLMHALANYVLNFAK